MKSISAGSRAGLLVQKPLEPAVCHCHPSDTELMFTKKPNYEKIPFSTESCTFWQRVKLYYYSEKKTKKASWTVDFQAIMCYFKKYGRKVLFTGRYTFK